MWNLPSFAAAAAAKSLQSCLTLCDPRDDSPPGSPVPGILHARTLEWVAISFSILHRNILFFGISLHLRTGQLLLSNGDFITMASITKLSEFCFRHLPSPVCTVNSMPCFSNSQVLTMIMEKEIATHSSILAWKIP